MKQADIGVNQELQSNGMIADSWMRKRLTWVLWMWIVYCLLSFASYEYHFWMYCRMVEKKLIGTDTISMISEQTYITLISQLEMINWTIFLFFGVAVFAPKAIQKFAEMKTGISDSSESTVTKTSEKIETKTN